MVEKYIGAPDGFVSGVGLGVKDRIGVWTTFTFFQSRHKMDRCKKCRIPCENSLCNVCIHLTECQLCERRLCSQLFDLQEDVCNACYRKRQRSGVRSAMGGIVEEHAVCISGIYESTSSSSWTNTRETFFRFWKRPLTVMGKCDIYR